MAVDYNLHTVIDINTTKGVGDKQFSFVTDLNGTYLSQIALFKRLDRHSGAGRNPGKRPPLVRLDPGLRRDDGGFEP